ncbi:MAG: hypothetical protein COA85_07860 [Robiginitomaculum sp.]|nr:MAG: hypothetical protein COA85_07860 [Robiginitomaculum sp.]
MLLQVLDLDRQPNKRNNLKELTDIECAENYFKIDELLDSGKAKNKTKAAEIIAGDSDPEELKAERIRKSYSRGYRVVHGKGTYPDTPYSEEAQKNVLKMEAEIMDNTSQSAALVFQKFRESSKIDPKCSKDTDSTKQK